MPRTDLPTYPPGRQPYDKLVGLRVGALTGGIVGIAFVAVLGGSLPWLIIPFALAGAVGGYLWQAADERRQSN